MPDQTRQMGNLIEMANDVNYIGVPKEVEGATKDTIKTMKSMSDALVASKQFENYIKINKEKAPKLFGYLRSYALDTERGPQVLADLSGDPDFKDAKQLKTIILTMMNPYRKDVTGAAASVGELANFIQPMFPSLSQSTPEDAFKSNRNYQYTTYLNLKNGIDALNRYNPNFKWDDIALTTESKKHVNFVDKMPEKLKSIYFGQIIGESPKIEAPKPNIPFMGNFENKIPNPSQQMQPSMGNLNGSPILR